MYQEDTELLFPPRLISSLRDLRGELWRDLVDRVASQEKNAVERLAFILLMTRLDGCATCQADSYRAMRGCAQCAVQSIRRYRGDEQDLIRDFYEAKQDVERYLNGKVRIG